MEQKRRELTIDDVRNASYVNLVDRRKLERK